MVTKTKAKKTMRKKAMKRDLKKGPVKRRIAKKEPVKKKVELKILGKSVLVDEDLKKRDHRLGLRAPKANKGEIPSFYRKFAFKCGKCVSEFKHTAEIPVIEQRVKCPECNEIHIIRIIPIGGQYEVKLPRSIKGVKGSR